LQEFVKPFLQSTCKNGLYFKCEPNLIFPSFIRSQRQIAATSEVFFQVRSGLFPLSLPFSTKWVRIKPEKKTRILIYYAKYLHVPSQCRTIRLNTNPSTRQAGTPAAIHGQAAGNRLKNLSKLPALSSVSIYSAYP